MKKIFTFIISITAVICFCLIGNSHTKAVNVPMENSAVTVKTAESSNEFAALLTDLVNDNWEDNYFSEIIVHENNTVTVNGSKTNQEINDILENGIDENQLTSDEDTAPKQESSASYFELEESGYKVTRKNNEVHITNPYQTMRLIVHTNEAVLNKNFGASQILSDGKGKHILQFDTEEETESAYEYLSELDSIKSVSIDSVVTVSAVNPLTQEGRDRWGAERIESDRYKKYLSENKKSSTVIVAVVDTGVELNHSFLKDRLYSTGYDFIRGDSKANDENMHGTHCSGIIADNTPASVKILPVKVLNSGGSSTEAIIALGIEYAAEKGADVISMSFGGNCHNDNCEISLAIKSAISKGSVCVVAAGNEAQNTENVCPARLDECITVTSVDTEDNLSYFSNFGDSVDIAAPGEDVWSSTLSTRGSYETASGTSMATPFVSAAAAMILTNNPKLTVTEVKKSLKNTTVDLGVKGEDKAFGAGVLDFGVLFTGKTNATSIKIKESTITLYLSDNLQFEAEPVTVNVAPLSAQNKSYSVKIKNTAVASFDGFGFLPKKAGETTATFTLASGKSASIKIKCVKRKFWIDYAAKSFAGGEGTRNNPYIIKTAEQLSRIALLGKNKKLRNDLWFKQAADIDLKGKTWFPIHGKDAEGLVCRINYDGGGYDIKNLQISNISSGSYVYYAGLFAFSIGELKNINLIDVDINCPETYYVAGICADFGGVMKNCYVSGKIKGSAASSFASNFGIINGSDTHREISNCRSDAYLSATYNAGGIVWSASCGHIENCVFTGKIDAPNFGGIAHYASPACQTHDADYGFNDLKIVNCISTENIIHSLYDEIQGGIITYPTIYNCYYSGEYESGISGEISENSVVKNVKKADDTDFKTASFYTNKKNWHSSSYWNTSTVWKVKNDYPVLASQKDKTVYSQFDYYEVDGTVVVNGYYGKNPHLTIPETINGYPVTAIGTHFTSHNTDVTRITLPDSVKIISSWAFGYDFGRIAKSLRYIDLGDGVEYVFAKAFAFCHSLNNITFPKSLKMLDAGIFVMAGVKYAFFEGDAVNINPQSVDPDSTTIYCKSGTKGWDKVKKNGLKVKSYNPDVPLKAYPLDDTGMDILCGTKVKLDIAVFPESASNAKLTYSSSNDVFSVDSKGYVTTNSDAYEDGIVTVKYNGKNIGSILVKSRTTSQKYTVKFNGNSATSGSMKNQIVPYNVATALNANAFKKTGYRFLGWTNKASSKTLLHTNKEKVINLTSRDKSVTLYAVWTPVNYYIKFNANGGSGKMSAQTLTYNQTAKISKNNFTAPEGKVFAGWSTSKAGSVKYTDAQSVKNLASSHKSVINLYVVWVKAGTFKLNYNLNGGTLPENYVKTYKSGTGTALPTPTRKGYDFSGWYLDSKLTKKISKIPTYAAKKVTLYAKWTAHKYNLAFKSNGGSGKMSSQTSLSYGKAYNLSKCTFAAPSGKVFAGWSTSKNGTPLYTNGQKIKNLTSKDKKTVTLYAIWITQKSYSIKYVTNGGTLPETYAKTYKTGSGYTLPTPTRKGYTFLGWYTDSKFTTERISTIKPWNTGSVTVYARWKKS